MIGLIAGLILFLGIHLTKVVAPEWRSGFIAKRGNGSWQTIYSLASLIGFGLIIWFYNDAVAAGPYLYEPPVWMKHINALLMVFAFISLGVYFFPAGRLKAALKHPMLLSVKIWALGHLLANGSAASLLLFGAFLAWAVIVRISLKKRERRGEAQLPVAGPMKWDVLAVLVGLALYALTVGGLHVWLFGVSPIAIS
ncbi:MAG: NnrU family protein [Notoacmeibacter sp.]